MENVVAAVLKGDDVQLLFLTALVAAAATTLAVVIAFFCWFRREQRRMQKRILNAIANPGHESDELFLTGSNAAAYGELVAQFKVNHGKQVVSLLEADGKRFIHVDGELSSRERARMVRYLKSEGFMS